ncbi:hypothetical protein NEF87_004243 [Candidatus Lokiarchaeum ossiferum]|uniref:Uncharacterized protein n=1 Tax=Candidatus Lokiarchaeum ossiferum TaxID=2951803 RepID=A0ABY6HX61_9ARCH|nr:hypothetical protein NEF87_004243 [Candidatus Lokiarchaeum sp. B-35]
MILVNISTQVFPTEDLEVIHKIFNYFSDFDELEETIPNEKGVIEVSAKMEGLSGLTFLYRQSRKQRIVQAIRNHVENLMDLHANTCVFMLNKQALTQGYIGICQTPSESPLGPIHVKISATNIERVINYLFPPTEKGHVLEVDYTPTE